jgi:hypothetical protein
MVSTSDVEDAGTGTSLDNTRVANDQFPRMATAEFSTTDSDTEYRLYSQSGVRLILPHQIQFAPNMGSY